ncbi:MAG: dTDP-4-dehydrorhamnose 3,5-epimerase family protein [Bacteriovoracaceae bacterium]
MQDNHSYSAQKGVLRGLHFQSNPCAQTKLVRVLMMVKFMTSLLIYEKVHQLFGEWEGFILNDQNFRELLVPRGFAHGFVTLTDNVHVAYKVDSCYSAENNCGILWNDRKINVDWGISNPILSEVLIKISPFDESARYFEYRNTLLISMLK